MLTTQRIQFEEVAVYSTKNIKCTKCGKTLKRSKKFYQTLNPFNKKNGKIKDRGDIYKELVVKSIKWKKQDDACKACK